MKRLSQFLIIGLSIGCSLQAMATVGGDSPLEFLGYEPNEQKVFILRRFLDETGQLPQLYYYDFKAKNKQKLIEVNSIYKHPKTGKIDKHAILEDWFDKRLKTLTKRLTPLQAVKPANISLNIISSKTQTVRDEYMYTDAGTVTRYQYNYNLSSNGYHSTPQTAYTFSTGLSVSQAFIVPKQNAIVASVKYQFTHFEGGYYQEDAVLLTK